MSLTKVDLPEPETPVTTVITPSGNTTSRFFRLFSRAPRTVMALPFGLRRSGSMAMCWRPEMYAPVRDAGEFMISAGVPAATNSPP